MQSFKVFSTSYWTNSLVTCHLRQHDVHVTLYNADTIPYPTFSGLLKQNMDKTVTAVVWTKYVASDLEWVMLSVIQVDVDVTKLSPIDNRVSNKHIYHITYQKGNIVVVIQFWCVHIHKIFYFIFISNIFVQGWPFSQTVLPWCPVKE